MAVWVLEQNRSRSFYEKTGARMATSKVIEIGGAKLMEVAYAWADLKVLASECRGHWRGSKILAHRETESKAAAVIRDRSRTTNDLVEKAKGRVIAPSPCFCLLDSAKIRWLTEAERPRPASPWVPLPR